MQPGFESPYPRDKSEDWERFQLLVKVYPLTIAPIWVSLALTVLQYLVPIPDSLKLVAEILIFLVIFYMMIMLANKMSPIFKRPKWLIVTFSIIAIVIPFGALVFSVVCRNTVKQQLLRFKIQPGYFFVSAGDQEFVRERIQKTGEKWAPPTD